MVHRAAALLNSSSKKKIADKSSPSGPLTVTELNQKIRSLLEDRFAYFKLRAEVANLRRPASGHIYLSLIDSDAQIRAVIWRGTARRLPFIPDAGQSVVVTGRIAVYLPRGEYQVIIEGIQSDGAGSEREKLIQCYRKLKAEGLFSEQKKQPLPFLPRIVGVVTSSGGAVIHDIIHVLDRRFPSYHLLLAHAQVQGEGAPEQISEAIQALNKIDQVDVIICGRGGGSAEDLAAFNSEQVVRAIDASKVPIVSAVGHEVDVTLADLAADIRVATPSAAAEMVLPEYAGLQQMIRDLNQRLHHLMRQGIDQKRAGVEGLRRRLRHPRQQLEMSRRRCDELHERLQQHLKHQWQQRQQKQMDLRDRLFRWHRQHALKQERLRLDDLVARLKRAMMQRIEQKKKASLLLASQLAALSPQHTLKRGFAIVRNQQQQIIHQATTLSPKDLIHITLAEGEVSAQVISRKVK
ncbi:exodeoxyribonuclease VII large subunit [Magnetococcales bacterium HHB-1]